MRIFYITILPQMRVFKAPFYHKCAFSTGLYTMTATTTGVAATTATAAGMSTAAAAGRYRTVGARLADGVCVGYGSASVHTIRSSPVCGLPCGNVNSTARKRDWETVQQQWPAAHCRGSASVLQSVCPASAFRSGQRPCMHRYNNPYRARRYKCYR